MVKTNIVSRYLDDNDNFDRTIEMLCISTYSDALRVIGKIFRISRNNLPKVMTSHSKSSGSAWRYKR